MSTPEVKLMGMLRRRRPSDVAVELECTIDELDDVLIARKIDPQPDPAPLPEHCTWKPEKDPAFASLVADGIDEWSVGKCIENACLWAIREGIWHVDAAGNVVKEANPELMARPYEWRPAA
ncbi:hypothetical protein [Devosia faecipullorum]|uniref:hypothetical protein n=1 Tax=Devosia faecipullorum TaxID=2755039 RepID=UPI00187BB298|nr:hypothetical protein [Devosia faecipullorum]MBE7732144.1 hypothetical protein [Devosia faecipullorum]